MLVFLAPDQQRCSEVIDAARRLLALRSIDDDKTTKKQLSEEQMKDLADRLKDAQARLPGALTTAYRHILVPAEKKTVRCLDMGISSYSGRTTLSSKVLEKLIDEGSLLDKLDPDFLVPTSALGKRFGLWPEDQEVINVRTLADYFTQLTHLPRLHGAQVLPECFAKGVQRGLFAYALGDGEKKKFDTIYFGDKAITGDRCEITESAWLLRPDLAKALMPKPDPTAVGTTGQTTITTEETGDGKAGQEDGWKGGGGAVKIVKGERRLNKVRLNLKSFPWENWNDIYNEVIDPLVQEGAELHCQLIIIAQGDAAIRENTVELGIKESLSQRGIDAEIEMG